MPLCPEVDPPGPELPLDAPPYWLPELLPEPPCPPEPDPLDEDAPDEPAPEPLEEDIPEPPCPPDPEELPPLELPPELDPVDADEAEEPPDAEPEDPEPPADEPDPPADEPEPPADEPDPPLALMRPEEPCPPELPEPAAPPDDDPPLAPPLSSSRSTAIVQLVTSAATAPSAASWGAMSAPTRPIASGNSKSVRPSCWMLIRRTPASLASRLTCSTISGPWAWNRSWTIFAASLSITRCRSWSN